jgi:hypothetical protein
MDRDPIVVRSPDQLGKVIDPGRRAQWRAVRVTFTKDPDDRSQFVDASRLASSIVSNVPRA